MMEFYIYQIGNIQDKKIYENFISMLRNQTIGSKDFLEKQGIKFENGAAPFELNIPDYKRNMYYGEDIHKDRVSLSDPRNKFIKKAIEKKADQTFACFKYDYIGFAVSRDVPIVPQEETCGLALGEVQVKDKIDSQYIVGLILPITEEQMLDEACKKEVDTFLSICEQNGLPLDVYNYEGLLIGEKNQPKTM